MNRVSVDPPLLKKLAKQVEYMENYDHMKAPDSVQVTQNGTEGEVRFRFYMESDE